MVLQALFRWGAWLSQAGSTSFHQLPGFYCIILPHLQGPSGLIPRVYQPYRGPRCMTAHTKIMLTASVSSQACMAVCVAIPDSPILSDKELFSLHLAWVPLCRSLRLLTGEGRSQRAVRHQGKSEPKKALGAEESRGRLASAGYVGQAG